MRAQNVLDYFDFVEFYTEILEDGYSGPTAFVISGKRLKNASSGYRRAVIGLGADRASDIETMFAYPGWKPV